MPSFGGKGENPGTLFVQVFQHSLGAIVNVEFLENFLQMTMYSPGADAKQVGDFLVRLAFAQQAKNFEFALGQIS